MELGMSGMKMAAGTSGSRRQGRRAMCLALLAVASLGAAALPAGATIYTWTGASAVDKAWSTADNWTNNTVPTFVAGDVADFSTVNIGTATVTVTLPAEAVTLGGLILGDTDKSHSYNLSGGAGYIFNNSGVAATIEQKAQSKGDTISTAMNLVSDLNITNSSTNGLLLSGGLSGSGNLMLATGTTTISGGTASSGFTGNFSATGSGTTLVVTNDASLGNTTIGTRVITIAGGATLRGNGFSGNRQIISGEGGAFLNLNSGNATLANANQLGSVSGATNAPLTVYNSGTGTNTLSPHQLQ